MVSCRVSAPPPPPPNGKARNPREGRTFVSKVPTVTGMGPPEPGILVSVVTFEAMQLRCVSKVATLTWIGHGFGPRRTQLLTQPETLSHLYT